MGLDWQPRPVPSELVERYLAEGLWTGDSLGQLLAAGLERRPAQTATFRSDVRPWRGSFAEVLDASRRVASGLARRGVGRGDVVAFQLPNWLEAAVTFYGAALLGAVVVPIVHFYGPKEVRYILERSGARLLVTADSFRGIDYLAALDAYVDEVPSLEHVLVAGSSAGRWTPFSELLGADPVGAPAVVDPASAALV